MSTKPTPRGPLSAALLAALEREPGSVALVPPAVAAPVLTDADVQTALYAAYEVHYAGLDGIDPGWEWEPTLLAWLAPLERAFEAELRALATTTPDPAGAVSDQLFALAEADDAPSLSKYVATRATREQAAEYLQHRSLVQLKESDAQSWLLPRLRGRAKSVMVEVQADEYGNGDLERMHSRLWATAMRGVGLADGEGEAVDRCPAVALAMINAQTMMGLHARLVGMGIGFFTMVEITSSVPMRRYARGFTRLGFGEDVTHYFTEHVAADAAHEQLMARELCDTWVAERTARAGDVLTGAQVCLALDGLLAEHCLAAWQRGESSLVAA